MQDDQSHLNSLSERVAAMWADLEELKFEAKFTRVGTLFAFLFAAERVWKWIA